MSVPVDFNVGTTPNGMPGLMFSESLGVRVATAPGVTTQGDTRQLLPEGLFVHIASAPDPKDASIFNPVPADIEILEAYARGATAFYRAALTRLTTVDQSFAVVFMDGGSMFVESFSQASAGGYL